MQVVQSALVAPACCRICNHADGPFIDTFRVIDGPPSHPGTGRVYVCHSCVFTFAQAFGILDEARAPVEAELSLVHAELAEAKLAAEFGERVEALRKELEERLPKKRAPRKKKTAKKQG